MRSIKVRAGNGAAPQSAVMAQATLRNAFSTDMTNQGKAASMTFLEFAGHCRGIMVGAADDADERRRPKRDSRKGSIGCDGRSPAASSAMTRPVSGALRM